MSMARLVGVLALVLVGTTACGGGSAVSVAGQPTSHASTPATQTPAPSPTAPPTVAAKCAAEWQDGKGRQVWFTDSGGASLGGIELGTGAAGVVLAHQAGADACSWLPYGSELAAAGYRVLAFDFAGNGASPPPPPNDSLDKDVLGASAFLRREGATSVVLMGAAMGAAASLVAASEVSPPELPVAGVISLSSPLQYSQLNPLSTAKKLTVPVLYIGGLNDPEMYQATNALYGATPGTGRTVLIPNNNRHGADLLKPDATDAEKVRTAVTNFLNAHAKV
jgi:pimeloyl-ACP methyl ester carboxylesterase